MSENKLSKLLESFDQNQLREINSFLSSAQGAKIKKALSGKDKDKLLGKFANIDTETARRKIKNMSANDISELIRRLGG